MINENIRASLIGLIVSFTSVALLLLAAATPTVGSEISESGNNVSLGRTHTFWSERLHDSLLLLVSEPEGDPGSAAGYPLLLTVRDQFLQSAGLVRYLSRTGYIPEIVVISITNLSSELLTPTPATNGLGGKADTLIAVLDQELFPVIDEYFRLQPYRVFFGSAWAGVFGTYAALKAPNLFRASIVAGPWLPYDGDREYLLTNAPEMLLNENLSGNYYYFTCGNQPEILPSLTRFRETLEKSGTGLDWVYNPLSGEDHTSLQPASLLAGLRDMYADWRHLPDSIFRNGREAIERHRDRLAERFGYEVGLAENSVAHSAWQLFDEGDTATALSLFELNAEWNGTSSVAHFSKGRAMDRIGRIAEALACYERAMALQTDSTTSQWKMYHDFLENCKSRLD